MDILPESKLSDEELAEKVKAGKSRYFALLVNRYEAKISRYAKRFLFENQDIEDVVQDVFISLYKNIQSFDSSKRFSPWLYRIAHNHFINQIKKKSKKPLLFFDFDIIFPYFNTKQEEAADKVEQKETCFLINKCLKSLKPKYREVLILYYFEELSYKEIADVLQIPISTVGIRLNRAKKIIKSNYVKLNNHL